MTIGAADAGCTFALVTIVAAITLLAIVLAIGAGGRASHAAREAAEGLGGRFEEGGWLDRPTIRFRACGQDAVVMFWAGSKGDPAYTRVVIPCVGKSPGALKVYAGAFGDSIAKWFGAQDLEVGDPAFDSLYVVKATPVSLVHAVFGSPARDALITTLRRLGSWSSGSLDVSRESLSVRVMERLQESDRIVELARIAERLYALIVSGVKDDTGIVWGATTAGSGQCQVCGAALAGDVVKCASCATPHHRECWRYVGECSTFACQSRRFV